MTPGQLRHQVTIETRSRNVDAGGGSPDGWAAVATVWARIEPTTASERDHGQLLEATISHQVTIRYLGSVSPRERLRFGSRVFRIHGVRTPAEIRHILILNCEEVAGDGR